MSNEQIAGFMISAAVIVPCFVGTVAWVISIYKDSVKNGVLMTLIFLYFAIAAYFAVSGS